MENKGAKFDRPILNRVKPVMGVVCEEIFGPAITIQRHEDSDR